MTLLFTLPYSFKTKPIQSLYLASDCENNVEEKIIVEIDYLELEIN
jgi:hypothetical protein